MIYSMKGPDSIVQKCFNCGALNLHSLVHAVIKMNYISLDNEDTFIFSVDGESKQSIAFTSVEELANKLTSYNNISVRRGTDAVLLSSLSHGVNSSIEVFGNPVVEKMGVAVTKYKPLTLGIHYEFGPSEPHVIQFRKCICGTMESYHISFENDNLDDFSYNHRKAINSMGLYLIQNKLFCPEFENYYKTINISSDIFHDLNTGRLLEH